MRRREHGGRKIQVEANGVEERRKGDRKRTIELSMGIKIKSLLKISEAYCTGLIASEACSSCGDQDFILFYFTFFLTYQVDTG